MIPPIKFFTHCPSCKRNLLQLSNFSYACNYNNCHSQFCHRITSEIETITFNTTSYHFHFIITSHIIDILKISHPSNPIVFELILSIPITDHLLTLIHNPSLLESKINHLISFI